MTDFPTGLDSFTNPAAATLMDALPHDEQHANANDAILALETVVGITGSAVTSTLEYRVTNLNASNLVSGTVPDARFPATLPAVSGVNLTGLNATNIASGTLALARLGAQTANTVLSGPNGGGAAAPTFRALVAADIPSLSGTYLPLAGGTMTGNITFGTDLTGIYWNATASIFHSANGHGVGIGYVAINGDPGIILIEGSFGLAGIYGGTIQIGDHSQWSGNIEVAYASSGVAGQPIGHSKPLMFGAIYNNGGGPIYSRPAIIGRPGSSVVSGGYGAGTLEFWDISPQWNNSAASDAPNQEAGRQMGSWSYANGLVSVGGFSGSGVNLTGVLLLSGGTMVGNILMTGNKLIGGATTTSDLVLQTTSGVGASGADMHFLVGNAGATEAMTILNNGNVGIGTTAPGSKLSINGGLHVGGDSDAGDDNVIIDGNVSIAGSLSSMGRPAGNLRQTGYQTQDGHSLFNSSGLEFGAADTISWAQGVNYYDTPLDLILVRDAANTLALRNGTANQAFRLYGLYTDASNYHYGSVAMSDTALTLSTQTLGTGVDNLDIVLTPSGTGAVITGNITMATAGLLSITSGANQRAGDAVMVGGTITVANTTVTANTRVFVTRKSSGGTIGFAVTYTLIAATSFTLTSDNILDTSTYSYMLVEVP